MQLKNRINFNNPINIEALLKTYNHTLEDIVTYSIGYDDKMYILLKDKNNYKYSIIVLSVDWHNSNLLNQEYYKLESYNSNFNMIQPIENNILLIASRCYFDKETGPEKNAIIIDYKGNIIDEFCFGDGINDCIVTKNRNIIISYFDEGIFGSNGWHNPIGCSGLVVWNKNGEIIWEADKDIDDCYAINIDEDDNIYYYYYSDFKLVKTDMYSENIYDSHIDYSHGFLITSDKGNIIFEVRNNNHSNFCVAEFNDTEMGNYEDLKLMCNDEEISVENYKFRSSKMVFIDNFNRLFVKNFI